MGLVLISPKKITIEKSLRLRFSATNNEVEYEALLVRMATIQKMEGRTMEVFSKFKTSDRLGEGRVRGQRCENARILKLG